MASEPMPAATAGTEPQAQISAFGRLVGVVFSPKATFEDIARKPSWWLPVVALVVLSVLVAFGVNQKMNWRDYVGQQIEKSPASAQLSAEQKEQRIEGGAKFAPLFAYLFGIPAPVLVVLAIALVMWGSYNLLAGTDLNFKTAFGIVSHAFVPALIGNILFLIVLLFKPYGTLDLQNPVATNVATFLPEDSAKWLMALGKNLDIFILWMTLLMAIGFAAARPKKLKGGKSFGIAFGLLAVWIVLRVGLAFIFS
jgi:Yip1 domain